MSCPSPHAGVRSGPRWPSSEAEVEVGYSTAPQVIPQTLSHLRRLGSLEGGIVARLPRGQCPTASSVLSRLRIDGREGPLDRDHEPMSEDQQLGFARSRSLRSERARAVQQITKDEVDESEHHRGASSGGAESAMLSDGAHTPYPDLSPSGPSSGGVDSPKG